MSFFKSGPVFIRAAGIFGHIHFLLSLTFTCNFRWPPANENVLYVVFATMSNNLFVECGCTQGYPTLFTVMIPMTDMAPIHMMGAELENLPESICKTHLAKKSVSKSLKKQRISRVALKQMISTT